MTAQTQTFAGRDSLLHRTLQLDGAFCVAAGLGVALAASALAGLTGLPAELLVGLGIVLMPYGALLLWAGTRPAIDRRIVWASIAADDLWIVGGAALLIGALPLTSLGWWLTLDLALAAAGMGIAKYIGLRRAG